MLYHQNNHRDFISLLPKKGLDHVVENILSYLDEKSLCEAELVCKEWYQVISEAMLWKKIIERRVRTDSLTRELIERRGWIKYLFKLSPGEPHPDHMFYKRLYPKILQDIESLETNWRCGKYTLNRIYCQSGGVCCVQYDDRKIVSGLVDNTIKIWDRNTLECIQVLTGHNDTVECLHYDDRVIISGSRDSTVRVWDVKTGELINTELVLNNKAKAVFNLRFGKGMSLWINRAYVDSPERHWKVWNIVSHSKITKGSVFSNFHRFVCCAQNVDNKYLFIPCEQGQIAVLNTSTGKWFRTLQGHEDRVTCLQQRDRLVVSGSYDTTIRLWDIESGACLRTLEGHKGAVTCIQFDNKRIVSGASDGKIKVWDLAAALNPRVPARTLCLRTLVEHSGFVSTLQFDDFQIVSSSSDDTILIWDFLNDTHCETPVMTYIKNAFKYFFSYVVRQILYSLNC